jgi:hypothetical protein
MRIDGLLWDDERIEHISRHGVCITEFEDVCFGKHVAFPAKYGSYVLYGQTEQGRYLKVIIRRLYGNKFEPRACYGMKDSEKKNYRKKMK